jgi:pyrroline-5-carboxylate reductase
MNVKNSKIGLIGAGNMGSALLRGIVEGEIIDPASVWIYDTDDNKTLQLHQELGVNTANSAASLASECNIIILAVKPVFVSDVLSAINNTITSTHLILSVAAGISIETLRELTMSKCYIIRAMPNTPALIGEGMTAICKDSSIPEKYMKIAYTILKSCGKVEFILESQIHGATAISGSSPAYAFLFLEALADGGVSMGLSREQSYLMAAHSLLGAAKLALITGKHPGELKDMVCSPGGTTIEAVTSLENDGFRRAIINAVKSCAEKSMTMEKGNKNS